jgi:hypothetical protein
MVLSTPPYVHVIVVVPGPTAVIRPVELTVATAGSLEVHVACDVTFCVVPSANTAVAINCVVLPAVIGPLIWLANATFTAST